MPIIEYQLQLDQMSLEIFPANLCNDPFIAYHGTSTFHSEAIERDGFTPGVPPFDIAAASALLKILSDFRASYFDLPKGFTRNNTAQGLKHYLDYIESGQAKISLASLSSACLNFSSGELKGGQALHYITEAKTIIEQATAADPTVQHLIINNILELFDRCENIGRVPGVVYAIRIPLELENFVLENNIIFITHPIPLNWIEGKVVINEPLLEDRNEMNQKVISKLYKSSPPVGLGVHFVRKMIDDNGNDIEIKIIDPIN